LAKSVAKVGSLIKENKIDMKCKVLRRTIRSVEDGSITIVYVSDEKLIAKFLKRKNSKKAAVGLK